jgi:hypothetical protein
MLPPNNNIAPIIPPTPAKIIVELDYSDVKFIKAELYKGL